MTEGDTGELLPEDTLMASEGGKKLLSDHSKSTYFRYLHFSDVWEADKSFCLRFFCQKYINLIFVNYKVGQQQ